MVTGPGCSNPTLSFDPTINILVDIQPAWHPGGQLLAYTHYPQSEAERMNGSVQIWTRTLDSAGTFLTTGSEPEFSPDGTQLAFVRGADIGIRDLASGAERRVTFLGSCFSPAWRPDGLAIAFTVLASAPEVPADSAGIWALDLVTSTRTQIARPGAHAPAWSPDGTHLAYVEPLASPALYDEIVVFSMTDSVATRLTFDTVGDSHPTWSPDGGQLAFTRNGAGATSGIWTMSATGKNQQLLAAHSYYPSWSSGAEPRIAFTRTNTATRTYALWVMNSNGTQARELPR